MPDLVVPRYPLATSNDAPPPICDAKDCSRELRPTRTYRLPTGDFVCERHERRVETLMSQDMPEQDAIAGVLTGVTTVGVEEDEIAPAPPRQKGQGVPRVLLSDDEFAVIDALNEAFDLFMALPQIHGMERNLFQSDLRHVEDRVMRRAAIRAYPDRFADQ